MFLTLHKITITAVPETLKLLKENTDKILQDIKAQDFPRRSQISQETISETHKLDSKKKKKNPPEWRDNVQGGLHIRQKIYM